MCSCRQRGSVRWRSKKHATKMVRVHRNTLDRLACTSAQTPHRVNLTTEDIKSNFTFDADLTGEK